MRGRTGKLLLVVASVLVTFLLCAAGAEVLLRVGVVWNEAYAERESERLWREADRRVLVLGRGGPESECEQDGEHHLQAYSCAPKSAQRRTPRGARRGCRVG